MLITDYGVYNTDIAIDTTNTQLAQGFKCTRDVPVGRVYLYLTVTGTPGGYLYIEIQEDSDGLPNGEVIDNGTSNPVLISGITTGLTAIDFDVDARPMLTGNETYHIVVRTSTTYTADASNYVSVGVDQDDPYYTKGAASEYASATWGAISPAAAFNFYVYTSSRTSGFYSSLQQIEALTKSLTKSSSGKYTADTIPTITEVVDFQDDVAEMLDGLLKGVGLEPPVSDASVSIIRLHANNCVAQQCEMTQMTAGFRAENSDTRAAAFRAVCNTLVKDLAEGGIITASIKAIETGGTVSGAEAVSAGGIYAEERDEYAGDENIIQPLFRVDMFRH